MGGAKHLACQALERLETVRLRDLNRANCYLQIATD